MPVNRYYSSTAQPTTLSGSVTSGATSITVGATTGFPASVPYTLALDYGAATEELVDVTAVAGTNLTVTRGVDGTSAQSHSLGAVVRHVFSARDASEFQTHMATGSAVHGLTGSVVGTSDVQTLSSKTLTSPTINAGALSGTFTGTPTFSQAVIFSGAPSFTGAPVLSGGPVFQRAAAANGAWQAQVSGDSVPRLLVQADGKHLWSSGSAAADVALYREGTDVLSTDDIFRIIRGSASDNALSIRTTADTSGNSHFYMEADGSMNWGAGGASSTDVTLYRASANELQTDDSFTIGGSLEVSGVGQRLFARKAANTGRASTTVTSADPDLTVSLSANSVYVMRAYIIWGNSEAGDIFMDFNVPSGATGSWSTVQPATSVTGDPASMRVVANDVDAARTYGWSDPGGGLPNGANLVGTVVTTNAGTYAFAWAQAASNASATTVYAHSWLMLERVA